MLNANPDPRHRLLNQPPDIFFQRTYIFKKKFYFLLKYNKFQYKAKEK